MQVRIITQRESDLKTAIENWVWVGGGGCHRLPSDQRRGVHGGSDAELYPHEPNSELKEIEPELFKLGIVR